MPILSGVLVELWRSEYAKVQSSGSQLAPDGIFDGIQPIVCERICAPDDRQDVDSLTETFDDSEFGRKHSELRRIVLLRSFLLFRVL